MSLISAALTTTFSPAPSCTANFYSSSNYYSIGGPSPSKCFPSGWASESQYFSPGLCPTGYYQACSKTSVQGGIATETQATCCPTGYSCYTPTTSAFAGQACVSLAGHDIATAVTVAPAMSVTATTIHELEEINGYGISIRFQAKDFPPSTTTTKSTIRNLASTTTIVTEGGPTVIVTKTATGSTQPTYTNTIINSAAGGPSPSTSSGTAIGFLIGIILACLLVVVGIVFLVRYWWNGRPPKIPDYMVYAPGQAPPGGAATTGGVVPLSGVITSGATAAPGGATAERNLAPFVEHFAPKAKVKSGPAATTAESNPAPLVEHFAPQPPPLTEHFQPQPLPPVVEESPHPPLFK